ncbi:hypothetical protein QCA50_006377 [Cerrena zonata]|uniref:Uncharacterized protein n=1 Tax=Cerrena zonata TaxID=2478898 RepID=A0AAW0G7Y4_9APHY
MNEVYELGLSLETTARKIEIEGRTEQRNIQSTFAEFKEEVKTCAQARAKMAIPKMAKKIKELKAELKLLSNDSRMKSKEEIQLSAALIRKRLGELKKQRYHKTKLTTAARYRIEGETISKYWSQINKEKKPQDLIYELKKPEAPEGNDVRDRTHSYERCSDKMVQIMKNFFDDLQHKPYTADEQERGAAIEEALNLIPDKEQLGIDMSPLAAETTEEDVLKALKMTENEKAAGLDGLPYEFYKTLNEKYKEDAKAEKRTPFDIISVLTGVYQDIEKHGCDHWQENSFTQGWICPLWKKNNPALPSNY